MRKNKFIALILLTVCALFMIVPAKASATTLERTLSATTTEPYYTQSTSGFYSLNGTIVSGYASANYTVGETTYTTNYAGAAGSQINFSISTGTFNGRTGKLEIIALANYDVATACTLQVKKGSDVVMNQSVLPARTTASGSAYTCTVTSGSYTITNTGGNVIIFAVKVTFSDTVTVTAGSQISADGSSFRFIGRIERFTTSIPADIQDAGFEVTFGSTTATVHCTMIYDDLTAIDANLVATSHGGTYYVFAYTLTNVPAGTTVTVRAFTTVAGVTVYSSSGTVSNVS